MAARKGQVGMTLQKLAHFFIMRRYRLNAYIGKLAKGVFVPFISRAQGIKIQLKLLHISNDFKERINILTLLQTVNDNNLTISAELSRFCLSANRGANLGETRNRRKRST